MRAIDHNGQLLTLLYQSLLRLSDALLVVVCASGTTSQDDESVLISGSSSDGSQSLFCDTHEVVLRGGSSDSVNSDSQITVRAVLETNGERQTRGKLSVQLRLCCSGTNGTNRDKV